MRIAAMNAALDARSRAAPPTSPVNPASSVPSVGSVGAEHVGARSPGAAVTSGKRVPTELPGRPDVVGIGVEAVEELVEGLNQTLQVVDKRLQFLVHEMTGRIYVKVINQETEEVIREIPPEKILDLVGRIQELVGILVDEKA